MMVRSADNKSSPPPAHNARITQRCTLPHKGRISRAAHRTNSAPAVAAKYGLQDFVMVGALHALHDSARVARNRGFGTSEPTLGPRGLRDHEVTQLQHTAQALLVRGEVPACMFQS